MRLPADAIFAEPSTVTGSIGVFGILPSFQGSMAKLGIGADEVEQLRFSGEPDLLNGPSPAASGRGQAGVDSVYQRFLSDRRDVARARASAEIDRVAQGRVWDGGTARQLGLVDQFGGLDEAIAKAAALAKIDDVSGSLSSTSCPSFEDRLVAMLGGEDKAESGHVRRFLPRSPRRRPALLARVLNEVASIMAGPSIQVRCLDCPPGPGSPRLVGKPCPGGRCFRRV